MHKIKLFVGLGNPGEQYVETRHNVGFWWIDFIGQNHKLSLKNSKKYFGEFSKHNEDGEVFFLKPSTFMNDSGKSVQALAKFYKIEPEEILVIHDELDIQPGTAKLKLGGGHGGHNGLKSIQTFLGSNNFWRLRIGVGHPGDKSKVIGYVLNKPSKIEMQLIQESIINSYKVFSYIMLGQFEKAMLNLHSVN
ncbi:MAG: aminoacyl-tRNA hydrolase [Proteobacteria bacterium]|nr:aminoacyl-tRNA hydrolase [Pseudomonadota bacterium]MDA0873358.1 aminoacyl-tRNA hydrolase [Pseudomonadota bacterium]